MDKDFLAYLERYAKYLEELGENSEIVFDFVNDLSDYLGYLGEIKPVYEEKTEPMVESNSEGEMLEQIRTSDEYLEYLEKELHKKDRIIDILLEQIGEN